MARRKKYNPERRAWKGKSYKKGRRNIREIKEEVSKDKKST